MKKLVAFVLVLVICFSVSACGKSQALQAYEALIAEIGEVSLQSENAIIAAEDAYDTLLDEEKEDAKESYGILVSKREEFDHLVEEAKKKAEQEEKLNSVKALIEAIGEITVDSENKIVAAEDAYNALSNSEKEMISDEGEKLLVKRATYDTLLKTIDHANKVVAAIDAIGTVTLKSDSAIKNAKSKYVALTAEEKKFVTNYSVLEAAEASYSKLWEAEKDRIIKEYSKQFDIDTDPVEGIKWYFHKNMPEYINSRDYIALYIGVKNNQPWICIRYNYTDDDWVFWEKLTIVVDGEKYVKTVKYYNITRDNDHGDVWEYYDEGLNMRQAMDTEELKMLQQIADSNETIIRFEGDHYSYDLYVSNKDKKIIRDVLTLYKALLG